MAKKGIKKAISAAEENLNIKKVVPRTVRPSLSSETASLPIYSIAKPEDPNKESATSDSVFNNRKSEKLIETSEPIVELNAEEINVYDESKELAELRQRLAELENTQTELIRQQNAVKDAWEAKIAPVKIFFKKHGLKVLLPLSLMIAFLITMLVSFVGVRGIYVSVENSNEYIVFTPSSYTYRGEDSWGETGEEGKWKINNGKIYLTIEDELFGKITSDYKFSRNGYSSIFIDDEEFVRVSLLGMWFKSSISIKVTIDSKQGNSIVPTETVAIGSKIEKPEDPLKTGYTFKGWYTSEYGYQDEETAFNFDKRIWETSTLYANYLCDVQYTVTSDVFEDFVLSPNISLLSVLTANEEEGRTGTYQYRTDSASDWVTITEKTRMPEKNIFIRRINGRIATYILNSMNTNGYYRSGNYIYFGYYPQTIKEDSVTVGMAADDDGYYSGSDGERYAKVTASPYLSVYQFSTYATVTPGTVCYFKVEPIKWRILSESGDEALILCESIIANKCFDKNSNNYKNSDIRSWLKNGFYYSAFNSLQQSLILTTMVDNSAASAGDNPNQYAYSNTYDKIFLLSYVEIVNTSYGFSSSYSTLDTVRRRVTSDYARCTGVYIQNSVYGCWWLRSHYSGFGIRARSVEGIGDVGERNVDFTAGGVVPALKIQLS